MILSKIALQLVALTGKNKSAPVFDYICIEPDGTVVATNGRVLSLVSPVADTIKAKVPLTKKDNADCFGERILLTSEAVRTILKAIPKDTQFKGLLEHCSIWLDSEGSTTVKVQVTDGRRTSDLTLRRINSEYITYEKVLKEASESRLMVGTDNIQCVLNRKRMSLLVDALDKVCPYDGEFSPIYWEFTKRGHVIVRAQNELTKQRMFSVFGKAEWQDGEWVEWDEWEKHICNVKGEEEMWTIIDVWCTCGNHKRKHIDGRVECSWVGCPTKKKKAVRLDPSVKSLTTVNTLLRKRVAVKLERK
jgi:hypothetical protein